ncbi:hypothetical protein [Pseudomonas chlororaphis]|uniref:hypothetical protein n=1 Tax=Pseudomonas chlororaphis TaxID=587753 RepID=UPI000696A73F|nr:hypothetical protein [Pseudomonas chlororaphis]
MLRIALSNWVRFASLGVRPAAVITASSSWVTPLPQSAGINEPGVPVSGFSSTNRPLTNPALGTLFG